MGLYDDFAASAKSILIALGQEMHLRRTTDQFDAAAGETFGATPADLSIRGAQLKRPPDSMVNKRRVEGTLEQVVDKYLVIDASEVPAITDKLVIGKTASDPGIEYTILEIDEVSPAGIPVVYFLGVRK